MTPRAGNKHKQGSRALSDAEEARIEAGIAADPDNPAWNEKDFRRAKAFTKLFPVTKKAPSRRKQALRQRARVAATGG